MQLFNNRPPNPPIRNSVQSNQQSAYVPKSYFTIYTGKHVQEPEKYSSLFRAVKKKLEGDFPGAIFEKERTNKDKETKSLWVGKTGYIDDSVNYFSLGTIPATSCSVHNRKLKLNSVLEKIAYDLYSYLSNGKYIVPKTRLATLEWINEFTRDNKRLNKMIREVNRTRQDNKLDKGLYILSRYIEGYRDLNAAKVVHNGTELGFINYILATGRSPEVIKVDGEIVPLVGFMEIMAVAKLKYAISMLCNSPILEFMIFREGKFNSIGNIMPLDSKYAVGVVDFIIDIGRELKSIYGIEAVNPSLYQTNHPANTELVRIGPGPIARFRMRQKQLELDLGMWVNSFSLTRLLDRELPQRRLEARNRILECYKSQQPVLDLSNLELNTLPDNLFVYLNHLTEFNLSNNRLSVWAGNIDKLLELKILNIKDNPLNIDSYIKLYNQIRDLDVKLGLNQTQESTYFNVILDIILDIWVNENDCSERQRKSRIKAKAEIIKCYQNKNKILYLSGNNLSNLPEGIFTYLPFLERLCLHNNKLRKLPNDIGRLINLSWLSLSNNQLIELPESIGGLTNLSTLWLYDNQLTKLPESIGGLTKLSVLWLNSNRLTELPESIGRLTNLSRLWLSGNRLTKLPESIGGLTKLFKLWLENNQLTELPESIGRLTNLSELKLNNNRLSKAKKNPEEKPKKIP